MERSTERDEFGNANILGVDNMDLQCNLGFEEFNRVTKALNKLAQYEDLEEQGKLLKLPCAVGDAVYRINKGAREPIISMEVVEIGTLSLKTGGLAVQITCRDNIGRGEICYLNSDFGRNIFISREEAEAALKEL